MSPRRPAHAPSRFEGVPATQVRHNGYTYYAGVVSGKALLGSVFVSRRHEDSAAGFNRVLAPARARDIARYLDDDGQSIPTNIVLSAQEGAQLQFADGLLSWEAQADVFLVLDGQHRLFSMQYADRDYEFPVAIYVGLTRQEEVRLFIDINTKQKGVPPALLLDIKQLAGTETSIEERLRRLFDFVGSDSESPLVGLLSPAGTQADRVSRVTFNSAMKRPMEAGVLADAATDELRGRIVVNYLRACDRILRRSGAVTSKLTRATVLQAFFEVFNEVVDLTYTRDRKLKAENFEESLVPLGSFDFDSYGGGNRPSKTKLVSDIRAALITAPRLTDEIV